MTAEGMFMSDCNCPQCLAERRLGRPIETAEDFRQADGFGCFYCAMTGYEDYPQNTKPCRVPGHQEANERTVAFMAQALKRPWTPKEGLCPFCHLPDCPHWTGMGWANPRFSLREEGLICLECATI